MLRTNETRSIKWHETCQCICRLNKIIYSNKQKWNKDKCKCEYKELIDKKVCDKEYIFNPSNCKCECYKSCNTSQYLNYSDLSVNKNQMIHLLKNVLSMMMMIKQKQSI